MVPRHTNNGELPQVSAVSEPPAETGEPPPAAVQHHPGCKRENDQADRRLPNETPGFAAQPG